MNQVEKRKTRRISERARVVFPFRPAVTVQAETLDISQGGLLIDSPVPMNAGEALKLSINLGDGLLKPLEATVKRSSSDSWGSRFLVAVEFQDTNHSLMEKLKYAKK